MSPVIWNGYKNDWGSEVVFATSVFFQVNMENYFTQSNKDDESKITFVKHNVNIITQKYKK